MEAKDIQSVLRLHVEAENAHDMQRTLDTLHPECVFEDVALGQVYRGREGAAEYYRTWWDAFSLRFRPGAEGMQHFTAGGMVVAEGHFFGTHIGSFMGVAPTGKEVDFRFVVVVSFRDGLMAGERFYYDQASLWRQIGASPRSDAP